MFEIWKNWTEFIKPKRLEKGLSSRTNTYQKYILEPLERGFGTTIGNAMRRVLLSSIRGAAITSVLIENVHHEFSVIPGVYEDVTDIILNLKGLNIVMNSSEPKVIKIDKEGPCEIRGKDIITDSRIKIINPEHLPSDIILNQDYTCSDILKNIEESKKIKEKQELITALKMCNGNRSKTAKMLGISRVTVWNRMKKYGII